LKVSLNRLNDAGKRIFADVPRVKPATPGSVRNDPSATRLSLREEVETAMMMQSAPIRFGNPQPPLPDPFPSPMPPPIPPQPDQPEPAPIPPQPEDPIQTPDTMHHPTR